MTIGVYKGISKYELNKERITSNGKHYNLNHNKDLLISMKYKGPNVNNGKVNSQGWERNSNRYFKELQQKHPEYFDKINTIKIDRKEQPIVNKTYLKYFPEYKEYVNEKLVHHHIGGDGQAVALPQSIHLGSGEIHNVEKDLKIVENGKKFSNECKKLCEKNNNLYSKNSEELKKELMKSKNIEVKKDNSFTYQR